METSSITCPRCEATVDEVYYGPCAACRADLRASQGADAKDITVEYEPKMNVTPNAVALKDD